MPSRSRAQWPPSRRNNSRHGAFVKRSLRPREFRTNYQGLHIPRLNKERFMNEAEPLRFIRSHTDIPVPTVYCDFQEDEAYYLITEYVEGVGMSALSEDEKATSAGHPGLVIPPYRALRLADVDAWSLRPADQEEYVFCHNDLSQQNVIVNPETLQINAVIDGQYAGFYPPRFEWPFFNRLGPSVAIHGEIDDASDILEFLTLQVRITLQRDAVRIG
ncbi:conserved hypothetical protein [Verticillium alfalfae VaMs.102]|uniref:Aminoglycoside phosphotransferase domain-containing protein n=1 Tax=Verticillium alfalfae (strain VaMs.102 / ATCC MYA-4576 / FGSC 10136) TaxID=526221 RepID=C9SLI1_VERA1|nr:conserved hypothetical protein [Verticillium alfalfae VaMs.102]EEY19549.1 conserved hypothetical protein [Verticillium alfalfae VaMs.102]